MDILGDLGGVIEILMIVLGTFLYPISEHSFILKALSKLYMARTRDGQLLHKDKCNHTEAEHLEKDEENDQKGQVKRKRRLSKAEKREIDKHRFIKISIKDSVMLYVSEILGRCFCDFCWSKKKKLQKLKAQGADKIEGELNIVKIMNYLRNFKVVLKNSLLTKDVKDKIKHTGKNLIELDSGSSSEAPISEDTQG
jgi:hypothetical protein